MVDLFEMALSGVAGIRIETAPRAMRQLLDPTPVVDPASASGTAVEYGTGRIISGTIVAVGADVRIRVDVYDAIRRRPQFTVDGRARPDSVAPLVDSLTAALLAQRLVPPSQRRLLSIGDYSTKSPTALQAYLVARRHALRDETRPAIDSLRSATRQDSTFGLAYFLLFRMEAAAVGSTGVSTSAILAAARPHHARYSERLRTLFEIVETSNRGYRGQAFSIARLAAARFPNDPEIAFLLADSYFHFGLNLGAPREDAITAFKRALAFDDLDPELLSHMPTMVLEAGDTASFVELERTCVAKGWRDCSLGSGFRALYRLEDPWIIARGTDSLTWGGRPHYLVRVSNSPSLSVAVSDSFAAVQTARSRPDSLRAPAFLARSDLALARGEYDRAWAFLDSSAGLMGGLPLPVSRHRLLHHIVTGSRGDDALPRVQRNLPNGVVHVAWWAAVRGPFDTAEVLLDQMESESFPDTVRARATASGLRAILALRRGDSAAARLLFARGRPIHIHRTSPDRNLFPGAWIPFQAAKLEAALGDLNAAKSYLADVYPRNEYVPFIGDVEEFRGDLSVALGDTATAVRSYREVLALWKNADPVLQPRVAAIRAKLSRIAKREP